MDITTRDTNEVDLPSLFQICCDPLVRPNQYKLTQRETVDAWKEHLFGEPTNPPLLNKCTTILCENEIIGHVNHAHYEVAGQQACYCGWNLAPAYWGKGIAVVALSQLFDSFFDSEGKDAVISDCFAGNRRCIRVMQKLDYRPVGIATYERLRTAVAYRCLHWIRRFQLDAVTWHDRAR